jgi:glucose/arabinose dehydrogenase
LAFPKLKWENWVPVDEDGTVNRPRRTLELTYAPGDSKRLYVLDQGGTIYTFENDPNVELAKVFLDIEGRVSKWNSPGGNEQGLLGLAMHPKFQDNGQFFVCYTKPNTHESVISRFKVSASDKLKADPNSEEVLMVVPQPYQNHNGGPIEFGNDGYLYIAFGDGGARNDPKANGQNRSQLLGSILRIDVDQKSENVAYKVPADNPFVGVEGVRPEIYAYGFRNPWRIAFDRKTGKLWCADVGQDLWEEVNVVSKGGNYGWSVREGAYTFGNRTPGADSANAIDPVWAYDHSVGKSITGGRVYRSDRLKELEGKYLYADYVSGGVWALTLEDGAKEAVRNEEVVAGGLPVLAFGQDAQGEVYVMIDSGKGESILRLEQDK